MIVPAAGWHRRVRILCVTALAAVAGLGTALPAHAQTDYPSKPIRIVVPFPPGGTPNTLARIVGQRFTDSWGQPAVVDNRPGANTVIGTEAVAKAAPDGYTLLSMSSAHVTTPLLVATPYDAIRDFSPVATLAASEFVMAVHPAVAATSLREFIALAKANPGQLNYASSGSGGAPHLAGELLNIMAGIKVQHVPYKGMGPAVTDLLGGQVQVAIAPPSNFIAHVKEGKLRLLAVSGENRSQALPQVPTFAQAGLLGFEAKAWYGILGPAGVPRDIVGKLSAEIAVMLALAEVREKLISQGADPLISTPERFAAMMKADASRLANVVKTANIKLEE